MAQLRREYGEFVARGAEVVVVGPEEPEAFRRYWSQEAMPGIGLPDPRHEAADLYGQEVNFLKLGRMPALFVVGRDGRLALCHYASSMSDIPKNATVLAALGALEAG